MKAYSERGIALVLTLFLTSALSVLAASLMFLSQTETYSSMNYKSMSQARYGAEAGVEKAANFLYDTTKYTKPGSSGADLPSTVGTSLVVTCEAGDPTVEHVVGRIAVAVDVGVADQTQIFYPPAAQ